MYFIKNYLLYYYSFLYMLYKNCLTIEAADYKIKKILPFDKPRITAFLNNAFYPDDPELKAMNVTEIDEYHNDHIVGVIDQGYSYAAVGQDGNTAGVLLMGRGFINRFSTKDLTKIMEEYPVGYFRKLLKFYLATLEIGRTMNIPNHNHSMHITAAAALPKLRRQGIMRRLFQHGSETAKREGFKLVTCTTASQYIANLCESLKWSCISVLPLNALVDDQGKPIFHVDVPPHRFTRIYAQKLE